MSSCKKRSVVVTANVYPDVAYRLRVEAARMEWPVGKLVNFILYGYLESIKDDELGCLRLLSREEFAMLKDYGYLDYLRVKSSEEYLSRLDAMRAEEK